MREDSSLPVHKNFKISDLKDMLRIARKEEPADLLLKNARTINVYSGSIKKTHIAIYQGKIVGFGDYEAKEEMDLKECFVAPGFIDAHVHIESSLLSVDEFVRAVLPLGTTTAVADPHEIANVLGRKGIAYMIDAGRKAPMNLYFTLPSCVPSTDMETAGAKLTAIDLTDFMENDEVVGLAEAMDFPGVIAGKTDMMDKIDLTHRHGKIIDGHAPGLTGSELYAYLISGVRSDHECTNINEAREKLEAGMHIMVREGTGAKNLHDLIPLIDHHTSKRMMWCTDDRHPKDLLMEGHIDGIVRAAIQKGVDPITAIQMATINPARYFHLKDAGAIAPGKKADMIVFSDLNHPVIEKVFAKGQLVAENGKMLPSIPKTVSLSCPASITVDQTILNFDIPAKSNQIRLINIVEGQIITKETHTSPLVQSGLACCDIERDLLKIAVVERHKGTGNIGKGFVKGFTLKKGAIAGTVAHDSHNIIVIGTNEKDMITAVKTLIDMGGGFTAVCDETVHASVSLPIAGLMADRPLLAMSKEMDLLHGITKEWGCTLSDPFMTMGFLALPVIPEIKITDKGLVGFDPLGYVPLFIESKE